jgi:hypothetical protein
MVGIVAGVTIPFIGFADPTVDIVAAITSAAGISKPKSRAVRILPPSV